MEFWDIYDANKQPTGRTMKRNDWCLKNGEYHLTVLGVVGRPDGKYLITKRVMTKAWAPGWWEVSGGGVQAGETSIQAAVRECSEETGLEIKPEYAGLRDRLLFEEHFFTGAAGAQVIRLLPALNITQETASRFVASWQKLTK